ncbi:MAG: hypothetical protein R2912_06600 [Eubacteriales bacterium]
MKKRFSVHKNTLILIAGIVWAIAGFNIVRIGLVSYQGNFTWWRVLLSIAVYTVFQVFIFGKMVKKHTERILLYEEERQNVFRFFDTKSYLIMAFMMTLGIGLRVSGVVPTGFIAYFYTGLGASLLTAGVMFIVNYLRVVSKKRE